MPAKLHDLRKFLLNKLIAFRDYLRKLYQDYPRLFWIVVGVSFIDGVGGTMLFPFFALYITQKFNVGMFEAGSLLGLMSLFGLFGGIVGGALSYYALHLRLGKRERFIPKLAAAD